MDVCPAEKREKKISETLQYFITLLIPALSGYGGQWEEFGGIIKKKMKDAIQVFASLN